MWFLGVCLLAHRNEVPPQSAQAGLVGCDTVSVGPGGLVDMAPRAPALSVDLARTSAANA